MLQEWLRELLQVTLASKMLEDENCEKVRKHPTQSTVEITLASACMGGLLGKFLESKKNNNED